MGRPVLRCRLLWLWLVLSLSAATSPEPTHLLQPPPNLQMIEYTGDSGELWPNNTEPGVEMRTILKKCSAPQDGHDLTHCQRKVEISLRLVNKGKMSGNVEYILITKVHDEMSGRQVYLVEPLVIQLQQQQVSLAYTLQYVKSINSAPYEVVLSGETVRDFPGCYTDRDAADLCLDLASGSGFSPGPTGFCCRCSGDNNKLDRRLSCGTAKPSRSSSAHCLKFSPLWYSVNRLGRPDVSHVVHIRVYRQVYDGSYGHNITWIPLSSNDIVVGTDIPVSVTHDNMVSASYTKQPVHHVHAPLDHKTNYLLMPEPIFTSDATMPNEIKYGVGRFLIMNEKELSLEGTGCEKSGISYPGFLSQTDRCLQAPQSCLSKQPRDIWIKDLNNENCADNETCESGTSHSSHLLAERVNLSSPALVTHRARSSHKLHTVFSGTSVGVVDIQVNADRLDLVYPGTNVEVHQITATPTWSGGSSTMSILLRNTGVVTADMTVRAVCAPKQPLHHKLITIHPSQIAEIEFKMGRALPGVNITCIVTVEGLGRTAAKMEVWYMSDERCFCLADCLCRCGSTIEALSCQTVSNDIYKQRGFTKDVKKWRIKKRRGFFKENWKTDAGLLAGALLFIGFIKAMVGVTASPTTGMFGFTACVPSNRVMPRVTSFILNILFVFLAPWLFIFWLNHLIAVKVRNCPQCMGGVKREEQPLLPRQSWSELVSTGPMDTQLIIDQYRERKSDVLEEHEMETISPEEEVAPPVGVEGPFSTDDELAELLEPGQLVFCHYSQSHPALINPGNQYSLCGTLMAINPGLYRFTLELYQTQVYENLDGQAHSLLNLHPLQSDQFTRVLTQHDVTQLISLKPREPCLNKVL